MGKKYKSEQKKKRVEKLQQLVDDEYHFYDY